MTEFILLKSDLYPVYADVDTANEYLEAASHGSEWRDTTLSDDDKSRYLITAARLLDRQIWKGDKTSSSQELAWPRSDTGIDGVDDDIVPENIINASIEIALALLQGSAIQDEQNTQQKTQSIKAGSVALTFFRSADGVPIRFPLIVQELLRDYLSGPSSNLFGVFSGTDGETITGEDFGFSEGL